MAFKLGKDFPLDTLDVELLEFNPFKTKSPLARWYEVGFEDKDCWSKITELALQCAKNSIS